MADTSVLNKQHDFNETDIINSNESIDNLAPKKTTSEIVNESQSTSSIGTPPPDDNSISEIFYTPPKPEESNDDLDSKKDSEITNRTFFTAKSKESLLSDLSFSDKTLTESSQLDMSTNSNTSLPSDRGGDSADDVPYPLTPEKNGNAFDATDVEKSANSDSNSETNDDDAAASDDDDWKDEDDSEVDPDINDTSCIGSYLRRGRNDNPNLPNTVTTLTTPDGSKVYLVGTAHFSLESQNDVAQTIRETQPDAVMVELCKSRVNILRLDEKTILEEAQDMNLEKIRSAIKQSGLVQGIMYLLLLSMSAHLTKELGMAPGGEFRRAFSEAKRVPGCLIHLGDRPIQITLQRALAALSVWQKLRLAWYMITCKGPISKEEVERCKQRDLLEKLLAEMTGEFPALSRVFVQERDIYLTHSLHLAVNSVSGPNSNQFVENPERIPAVVVGVVGIGHIPGIVQNWSNISEADLPPLMKIPEPTLCGKIIKYTFRASLLGVIAWGCWKTLPIRRVTNFVVSSIPPLKKS